MRRLTWVLGTLLAAYVGCTNDNTGPEGKLETELSFVRHDSLAPALVNPRDSFWAKVGDGREIRIRYEGETPADTGSEFLRFEVPGDGLYRKPDGSSFAAGDSILITVSVVDSVRFLVQFEPAGLRFNPEHPARLKIDYEHADHDFDDDGGLDPDDDAIEMLLDLWYQAVPGARWLKVGAVKFEELDELSANIFSFSKYAVAW